MPFEEEKVWFDYLIKIVFLCKNCNSFVSIKTANFWMNFIAQSVTFEHKEIA